MTASKSPKPPKQDPATVAVGPDQLAQREAELERRRRGGFYTSFRRPTGSTVTTVPVGGEQQTVG